MTISDLSDVDIRLLRLFLTVVRCGGFSAAQAELSISLAAISVSVSDLEARLGIRLCDRGRSGFRLTDKGRMVYRACQDLKLAHDQFRTSVGILRGQLVGNLDIGIVDNAVFDPSVRLYDVIRRFRREAPNVHITMYTLAPNEVERAILDRRLDLGISIFHQKLPTLHYEPLTTETLFLFCGSEHPLFESAPQVAMEAVKAAPYVTRGWRPGIRLQEILDGFSIAATAHSMEAMATYILSGEFIGYMPLPYADVWMKDDRMRPLLPGVFRACAAYQIASRLDAIPRLVVDRFRQTLGTKT